MRRFSLATLRVAGLLVLLVGVLHLLMTQHLMHWFGQYLTRDSDVARAAMLLNHLVVGVLLLPLGIGLAAIARPLGRGEPWAVVIAVADCAALLALPAILAFSIRGPMLDAPACVAAAICLTIAPLAVTIATTYLWLARPGEAAPHT